MKSESEDKAKGFQMPKVEADELDGWEVEGQIAGEGKKKKRAGRINKRSEKVIEFEDKVDGRWTDTGNKAVSFKKGMKRMRGGKWGHFRQTVEE